MEKVTIHATKEHLKQSIDVAFFLNQILTHCSFTNRDQEIIVKNVQIVCSFLKKTTTNKQLATMSLEKIHTIYKFS